MAKYFTIRFLSGTHWLRSISKMTEAEARQRFRHTKWESIPATEEERNGEAIHSSNVIQTQFGKSRDDLYRKR